MSEPIPERAFVYCHNCRKGYIGTRDFQWVPSQHEGHDFDVYREKVKPKDGEDGSSK